MVILEGLGGGQPRSARQGTRRLDGEVELRRLNDGRTFRVVKRYDGPEDLRERLLRVGLSPDVGTSGEHFLYARAQRKE